MIYIYIYIPFKIKGLIRSSHNKPSRRIYRYTNHGTTVRWSSYRSGMVQFGSHPKLCLGEGLVSDFIAFYHHVLRYIKILYVVLYVYLCISVYICVYIYICIFVKRCVECQLRLINVGFCWHLFPAMSGHWSLKRTPRKIFKYTYSICRIQLQIANHIFDTTYHLCLLFPAILLWLFSACGWYAARGRLVNFEICHLRSLQSVANFKNNVFRNGCIGKDVSHAVVWSSGGWGGVLMSLTSTSLTLRNMFLL